MNQTPSLGHSSLYTHCSLSATITFLSCLQTHTPTLSVLQRPNVIPSCVPTLKMMQFQYTGPCLHTAATSRTNTWAHLCLQTDHQPSVYPKSRFREKRETKTELKPNWHSNSYSHKHTKQAYWKAASENNSSLLPWCLEWLPIIKTELAAETHYELIKPMIAYSFIILELIQGFNK